MREDMMREDMMREDMMREDMMREGIMSEETLDLDDDFDDPTPVEAKTAKRFVEPIKSTPQSGKRSLDEKKELLQELTDPELDKSTTSPLFDKGSGYGDLAYQGVAIQNPAENAFPFTLPVEVALNEYPVSEICESYGISMEQYGRLSKSDAFIRALNNAKEMLVKEGMSFKVKAKLQAENLLTTSWGLIHDVRTPHNVRADLIKSTIRWAGYEAQDANGNVGSGFSININFSREDNMNINTSSARSEKRGILIDQE